MRLVEACLHRLCLLICLLSTCYMTYFQFKYYFNDEDLLAITYRKFNAEEHDEYPTFSICVYGVDGAIFKQSHDIFKSSNITRATYYNYLNGSREDYSAQLREIKFHDVALDIDDGYLVSSNETFRRWGKLNAETTTLIPAYRDHEVMCISKNITYRKDVKQNWDLVVLKSSIFYDMRRILDICVHQKGRLSRAHWTGCYNFEPKRFVDTIVIDVGQVEVVKKREKGKIPCDPNLEHEDKYMLRQIIQNVGCLPTYWEKLVRGYRLNQTNRICKTVAEYKRAVHQYLDAIESFEINDSSYKKPCTVMMTSITTRETRSQNLLKTFSGKLFLYFSYHQNVYREIVNTKAYTSETLLAQVGGFVGM